MRHVNLDLDTLRTLAVAHDRGGLAQAAEHLGLTENGEVVLSYARRILALNDELLDITRRAGVSGVIRIGGPQDFG